MITSKQYTICPAILQLMMSGAISVMKPDGTYAQGMTFYSNRREAVLFDFETQHTFPVDVDKEIK